MGAGARLWLLSIAGSIAFGAVVPNMAQPAQLPLLSSCQSRLDQTDSFTYRFCAGYVGSFDGVPLDVDVTMPDGATPKAGYPLVVMMHGWGGTKSDFESSAFCLSSSPEFCKFNNLWLAHLGYAVLTYTARGFHGSCGPDSPNAASPACARGWTHLSDMRYESHDTQYLAGLLVDAGVAQPGIGVTGLSYGAGQSWLLAVLADQVMATDGTLSRWKSPAGTPLTIAAAVPRYGWSDLIDALQPNGRSSDGVTVPNGDRTNPFGIEKQSYVDYLYASGLQTARYAPAGQDPTADLTTWYTEISAGETPAQTTYAPGIIAQITQYRSAYYQDALVAHDMPNRETPVLDVQGWTDNLFPEAQGASMVEKLRAADPRWPAFLYASDLGHPAANNTKTPEWSVINPAATDFLDLHVKRSGGRNPATTFQEQVVMCDDSAGAIYASNFASGVAPGRVTFQSAGPGHLTASAPTDAAAGTATDPIAFYAGNRGVGGCIKLNPAPVDTTASTSWTFPVCSDFTLLGEPELQLSAGVTGTDAEINSRMWDVAPDGSATLVTRGAFRWTAAATAVDYSMQGTGWVFHAGHTLRLQVTQNDAPYLRPDNYASAITYSSMKLQLPATASIGC
jgi:fermentation-respiration switch protein FrsA (DUF1100 family)